jgi:hypothetical protein
MLREIAQALDPVIFARESIHFDPDPSQERALRSVSKRVLFNCCRQWGKSVLTAVKALHRSVYYPKSLILLLSPSLRQSAELFRKVANFSRVARNIPEKTEDSKLFMTLENESRIVSLPGKEGTVRGYSGADLIIIDEAAQVPDELYMAIRPMLAVSEGSLILISTPRGKRGFFHKEWADGGSTWDRIMVTADECPRISKDFLKEEYEALGKLWFAQEYMCEFVDPEGQLISFEDIKCAFSDEVKPFYGSPISDEVKPFLER